MEFRLQMILMIATILLLVYIFHMIRRGELELKYSLVWIFVSVGLIVFSVVPHLLDHTAALMGVIAKENVVFLIGIGFELLIIFTLTVSASRNSIRMTKMAQEIALLNKKLETTQNKDESIPIKGEKGNGDQTN